MSTEYRLPALPFGSAEATITRWLKQPGDQLVPGDPLLVAANDCVEVLFPATVSGTLEAQLVAEGATTTVGAQLARVTGGSSPADASPAPPEPAAPNHRHALASAERPSASAPRRASPVALRIAGLSEIDIRDLTGTGPGGRILKSDVLAALDVRAPQVARQEAKIAQQESATQRQEAKTASPASDTHSARPAAQTAQPAAPSPMRRAIAEHMVRSRATSPHAMTAMEADMSQVAAARARHRAAFARRGLDLTYTACIALATVEALRAHPLLNSSWSDDGIIVRRRIHLGVAVALPTGLVTPVVRNAQDLNLRGIARAVGDLARRARAGALQPGEASGGTFTITNPGGGALWFGTPIINQPQSAILGVGAVQTRPLVVSERGDRIVTRPIALLTLAYDVRVLDQPHADAFLNAVKRNLEQFQL